MRAERRFGHAIPAAMLLLLLVASVLSVAAAARAQDVPLSEYHALIREYRAAAERGLNRTNAAPLKTRFENISAVRLPDGTRVPVDNTPDIDLLDEALIRKPAQTAYETAIARARALDAALTAGTGKAERGDPKQQAATILAAPEFQEQRETARKPQDTSWFERLVKSIADWLDRMLRRRSPQPNLPDVNPLPALIEAVRITLYAIAGAGALVAIYFLARYLAGKPELGRRRTKRTGIGRDALDEDALPDPLNASRRLAAEGDYRGAVRLAYIASLRRLAAAGLLVLQENKTNWEYQRVLRRRSTTAYDVLLPVTRLFDDVWYGQRQATAEEYAQVVEAYTELPDAPIAASLDDAGKDVPKRNFSQPGNGGSSPDSRTPREGDNSW